MSTVNFNGLKSFDGRVSEAEFNRLVDAMQSITLGQGRNYTILRTPAGTTIQPRGNDAAPTPPCELRATRHDATTVRVRWGRVNFMQPAVFDGVAYWEFDCTSTQYIYAYADYDTDSGQWSAADLIASDTATQDNTSSRVYVQIAACIVDEHGLTVNSACGPVTLDTCSLVFEEE